MNYLIQKALSHYWKWFLAGLFPFILFLVMYPNYLLGDTFFWVSVVTLPLSFVINQRRKSRFFYLALVLACVTFIAPTTIAIYFMMCLILLFVLEKGFGGANVLVLFHVLLISPFFTYVKTLISFPIRIYLSEAVSLVLQFAGFAVHIDGNLVTLNGSSFLVDQACSGLHMLGYGLLTGTLLLAYFSRVRSIGFGKLAVYYILLFGLILIGNVIRITILVLFTIMPDQWLHEILGLVIYVSHVLMPFYFVVKYTWTKKTILKIKDDSFPKLFPVKKYAVLLILYLVMMYSNSSRQEFVANHEMIKIDDFETEQLLSGVTKLSNVEALIYFKPPVAAYHADHNPMICWLGSGYEFKKIDSWELDGQEINHAELVRENEKLYTAWWFESATDQTGDQWKWRKRAFLTDEGYYLINLTCNTKDELRYYLHKILKQKVISTIVK